MFETILVPVDGSEGSERAIDRAVDLASRYDAGIQVLSVVEVDSLAGPGDASAVYDEFVGSVEASAQRLVDDAITRIADAGVDHVDGDVAVGVPATRIRAAIDEHDADCVVLGTHGRSGLSRVLIGSVAEKVVRTSPVPVLTVPLQGDEGGAD